MATATARRRGEFAAAAAAGEGGSESASLLSPQPASGSRRLQQQPASASNGGAAAAAASGSSSSSSCLLLRCLGAPSALLGAGGQPLVVPSDRAFKALLLAPLLVWWAAVLAGVWVYQGLPRGQRVYHGMMWFDRGVLRPAGGAVPFIVLGARLAAHGLPAAARAWASAPAGSSVRARASRVAAGLQLGSLALDCAAIYAAMAAARLAIYLTHFFLLTRRYLEFHIVSDHIFLAATMLICLHTELLCLLSDMGRASSQAAAGAGAGAGAGAQQQRSGRGDGTTRSNGGGGCSGGLRSAAWALAQPSALLTGLFMLAVVLYLCTAADMYYTAKYYHFPLESLGTTVVVFLMFQAPMLLWLTSRREAAAAHHKAAPVAAA